LPFLIGLLLTPVGAWIGTVLFFSVMTVFSFREALGPREWGGALLIGTIMGSLFASPVTLLVLPATYAALRRRNTLTLGRLAIAGAVSGLAAVLIVMSLFWGPQKLYADLGASALAAGLAADGAVTGAICGALLALITRRSRTGTWRSQPSGAPA